jgi:hypothetical protein
MQSPNIMAVFCEDIREEKNGMFTLVGILPDHVNVANPPGEDGTTPPPTDQKYKTLNKVHVYARIAFDPDYDIGEPEFFLVMPHGEPQSLGKVSPETVAKAKDGARKRSNPLAGIIFRVAFGEMRFTKLGVMRVELKMAGALAAFLAISARFSAVMDAARALPPFRPPFRFASVPGAWPVSGSWPVAIFMICTARDMASAGRFWPWGPLGMGLSLEPEV